MDTSKWAWARYCFAFSLLLLFCFVSKSYFSWYDTHSYVGVHVHWAATWWHTLEVWWQCGGHMHRSALFCRFFDIIHCNYPYHYYNQAIIIIVGWFGPNLSALVSRVTKRANVQVQMPCHIQKHTKDHMHIYIYSVRQMQVCIW